MLLAAAAEIATPEERKAFLCAVCEDAPELLEDLVKTVTLAPSETPTQGSGDGLEFARGDVLAGRFEIIRKLGEGGMAVVYEALDRKLGERRALKFPKLGHGRHIPEEARHALRVTHENICRTHEIHTAETEAGPADFLSMELVEGETLFSRLRSGALAAGETLEIARQLCRGVEAAHEAGILHGDLKTNNVMLTQRCEGGLRVVIMDFGLALPLGRGRKTATEGFGGTPNYIAPERWKAGPATPACDVYAVGVILHEILTGRVPFPKGTAWAQRLGGLPAPPSKSDRRPNKKWDVIVLGCLQPDPSRRFASAGAVLAAIERAFGGLVRRRWLIAAAVVLAGVFPVTALRNRIWPPPLARLAVLPFAGSAHDAGVDQGARGALFDLGRQLESLGAASQRLVVIPFEDSLRYQVGSASSAAARLGATHVLVGSLEPRADGFVVRASVMDARTGISLETFEGEFGVGDLAALPDALAGVVTAAFHLGRTPKLRISAAAYPDYALGLASLRAVPPDVDRAIASFEKAVERDAGAVPALCGLADALLERQRLAPDAARLARARTAAVRARSLQPDSPAVLLTLGAVEQNEGSGERALEMFRRAAELEPRNAEVWRRTGVALQSIGRNAEAVAALRRAVELAPEYYAPHRALGAILFRGGKTSEAAEEFRTMTKVAPGMTEGYTYLGAALLAMEQDREAEQALRESVRLQPTRGALNNLGVLLRFRGRDREAVPVLEQALRAGADDAALRLNLGNALRSVGRSAEARIHFARANELARAALRQNPRDATARARLAYSMVRMGDAAVAGDEALQAARLAPSDYSVLFWSVMTLEGLGRRDEALGLLKDAPYERLRELRRQPDLAGLVRDTRFQAVLERSKGNQLSTQRRNSDGKN